MPSRVAAGSLAVRNQVAPKRVVTLVQHLVLALDFGRGIDVDDARVAVEHQVVALGHRLHQVVDADHGGNLESARQQRGVRGRSAGLQGDADEVLVRHQRELRERQFLGHEDGRFAELIAPFVLAHVAQQAMADVAEVGGALAQIAVGHRQQLRAQLVDHPE